MRRDRIREGMHVQMSEAFLSELTPTLRKAWEGRRGTVIRAKFCLFDVRFAEPGVDSGSVTFNNCQAHDLLRWKE